MNKVTGDACEKPQVCDPKDYYITEEWFLMDLLNTLVEGEGKDGKCSKYDTSKYVGGDTTLKQETSFSW